MVRDRGPGQGRAARLRPAAQAAPAVDRSALEDDHRRRQTGVDDGSSVTLHPTAAPPRTAVCAYGGFFVPRRYSLVTEAGYVPAHGDRPDGARGGPRAALARAAGHEPGRPAVPRRTHDAGPPDAAAAARARGGARDERLAGDPALRPLLPVDLRVGPGGGHLRRGTDDFRHARLIAPRSRWAWRSTSPSSPQSGCGSRWHSWWSCWLRSRAWCMACGGSSC